MAEHGEFLNGSVRAVPNISNSDCLRNQELAITQPLHPHTGILPWYKLASSVISLLEAAALFCTMPELHSTRA
jgi:hypothetical protein